MPIPIFLNALTFGGFHGGFYQQQNKDIDWFSTPKVPYEECLGLKNKWCRKCFIELGNRFRGGGKPGNSFFRPYNVTHLNAHCTIHIVRWRRRRSMQMENAQHTILRGVSYIGTCPVWPMCLLLAPVQLKWRTCTLNASCNSIRYRNHRKHACRPNFWLWCALCGGERSINFG